MMAPALKPRSKKSRSTRQKLVVPAIENITLPMSLARREPDRDWLDAVIAAVGLADRLKHRPNELSGGQQQRVAVARALASRPEIIFADEPTGNLDSRSGIEIMAFLQHLNEQGVTIVVVTHDINVANHAQRVVEIKDGQIVADWRVENRIDAAAELDALQVGQPVVDRMHAGIAGRRSRLPRDRLDRYRPRDEVAGDRQDQQRERCPRDLRAGPRANAHAGVHVGNG